MLFNSEFLFCFWIISEMHKPFLNVKCLKSKVFLFVTYSIIQNIISSEM